MKYTVQKRGLIFSWTRTKKLQAFCHCLIFSHQIDVCRIGIQLAEHFASKKINNSWTMQALNLQKQGHNATHSQTDCMKWITARKQIIC